jgi:hypothetical protein
MRLVYIAEREFSAAGRRGFSCIPARDDKNDTTVEGPLG